MFLFADQLGFVYIAIETMLWRNSAVTLMHLSFLMSLCSVISTISHEMSKQIKLKLNCILENCNNAEADKEFRLPLISNNQSKTK